MNGARKTAGILAAGVLFFFAGCSAGGMDSGPEAGMSGVQIQGAQKFALPDLNGQSVRLEDLLKNRKAVLINFWATWCPPCREEIPGLIRLQERHKDHSFTIVGVNVGESGERVSSFAKRAGMNYPVVLDESGATAESYRVVGIPTSLLIGPDGKIIDEYHAFTPKLVMDVEKALE